MVPAMTHGRAAGTPSAEGLNAGSRAPCTASYPRDAVCTHYPEQRAKRPTVSGSRRGVLIRKAVLNPLQGNRSGTASVFRSNSEGGRVIHVARPTTYV